MAPHVRPQHVVTDALECSDRGMPDAENAERHGVAIKTIRRWRREYQRGGRPRGHTHTSVPCPICGDGDLDEPAYAELLGWYLGDGHISQGRRRVCNLRVFNDSRYAEDNAHIADLMRAVKPGGRPHTRAAPGSVITTISWQHWPCLFPQHGAGRKHERPIILTGRQREIVERCPGPFLRGLFHSDGSRTRNWATRVVGGRVKRYDYPRWEFTNASEDILGLCCSALDLVGIAWRRPARRRISVGTRAGVARLDDLIGLKR